MALRDALDALSGSSLPTSSRKALVYKALEFHFGGAASLAESSPQRALTAPQRIVGLIAEASGQPMTSEDAVAGLSNARRGPTRQQTSSSCTRKERGRSLIQTMRSAATFSGASTAAPTARSC